MWVLVTGNGRGYIWILELGWVSNVVRPRSNSTLVVLG